MFSTFLLLLFLLLALPWLSLISLENGNLYRYLEFPPAQIYVKHAEYDANLFSALCIILILFFSVFIKRIIQRIDAAKDFKNPAGAKFPLWGYAAAAFLILSWVAAWTRFEIFSLIQNHTFIPLWLGFIFFVNALCQMRHGSCPLLKNPFKFLMLFPISALFWWIFEYINRFIQNWIYLGVSHFTAREYFILASLSFSTVLPAVLSVRALLNKNSYIDAAFKRWFSSEIFNNKTFLTVIFIVSALIYSLLGAFPNELFWFVWVATPVFFVSIEGFRGRKTFFSDLEDGNWQKIIYWSLSGLICGFFWEMWNYYSLSKWIYQVPYVGGSLIFEMPVTGYAGYIPFGIFCGLVLDVIWGEK